MARALNNPFSPSFGGMPARFFGRLDIVDRVLRALDYPSSPDSVLFFTGPRGCGKTALLEHLSQCATERHWMSCDVHSSNAVESLRELLAQSHTFRLAATPKVSLPDGTGISLESQTSRQTSKVGLANLLMQSATSLRSRKGIFITIDEIQKIDENQMEEVCAAAQLARRKGLPVILMMAGLPRSKELVAGYKGCTFMQRVEDVQLGSLLVDETYEAFGSSFALVGDLQTSEAVVRACAELSQGYPYLVQLIGYQFLEHVAKTYPVGVMRPTPDDARAVEEEAYETYRANVLVPSTKGLGKEARAYLRAMSSLMDDAGFARTADIARALGREGKQLSSCRKALLDRRLILSGGYGKVCYGLPCLLRYSLERTPQQDTDFTNRWVPR